MAGKSFDCVYDTKGNCTARQVTTGGSPTRTIKLIAALPDGGRRELTQFAPLENIDAPALVVNLLSPETIDGLLDAIKEFEG